MQTVRQSVAADAQPVDRLAELDKVISECLAAADMAPSDIWAVTVAVTGAVDASGRTSFFTPLPGWKSVSLAEHLSHRFACPVVVENGCKLAAVAEQWKGAASDATDIVYLLAGMRTGALKHVRWLNAPEHLQNCPGVPDTVEPDDAAAWVFNAAREGNKAARGAVGRYVKDLAVGAAALVLTLDP